MDDLALIIEVNRPFEPFYPYVARQIEKAFGRKSGTALALEPHAPGPGTPLLDKGLPICLIFPHFESSLI